MTYGGEGTTNRVIGRLRFPCLPARPARAVGLPFFDWAARDLFALPTLHARNKTRRAEASFNLYDDDNGPGSEPPPQDRLRLVSAVTPSRRRSPAAVGKPSLACFYGPRATCCRCAGPAKRPLAFDRDYASKRRSTEDPKSMALTAGIGLLCYIQTAVLQQQLAVLRHPKPFRFRAQFCAVFFLRLIRDQLAWGGFRIQISQIAWACINGAISY